MKKSFFLLIFMVNVSDCFAYPITPRPLRQLIIESQYIISGKVIAITELPTKPDLHFPEAVAKIQITKVLKGAIATEFIDVYFDNYYGCPQPAHYEKDTNIMAFLMLANNKFSTHALSYGSKTLNVSSRETYEKRVIEMNEILKISSQLQLYQETVDWLIRCTENESTKWEGIFELSPQSDFMSSYSKANQANYGQFLTGAQKNRLFAVIEKKKLVDYGDFGIIDLTYGGHEKFIDHQLIESLRKLEGFNLIFASEYMARLKHLITPKKFEKFMENQDRLSLEFESTNEKKQKKNIDAFIAALNK